MSMLIGVPLETAAGETRVAVTPETAKKLKSQGHQIRVQTGAGVAASAQAFVRDAPAYAALALDTDAAAALRLMARLWQLDWPAARLEALAATLGADVPACVQSRTVFGSGRGDALAPWPDSLAGTPVLLVNPGVAVPTGPVFAGWDRQDRGGIIASAPLPALRNDMTAAALHIAPVIGDVLAALAATGPALARMSGSGATCLALYGDAGARDAAAAAIATHGWWQAATVIR
jgi:4-diphosphocytidyl-2-C-methyl-D-erythritol kinase